MAAGAVTFASALNRALRDAVVADDRVLIFGEDVGVAGGVFRITDGIARDHGDDRCFDTPLAESGIIGFAVGLCMSGMRPVVEMQFDAFAYPAFEQITSHVAKMRNRTRGALPMPMVIRIPYAGGIGGVEHHCDSSEAYYAHTPGLRVYTPATVEDAYTMLRAAIDDPDPVIFMEPKRLYWSKDDVDLDALAAGGGTPVGQAVIRRPGTDATLVAYGPSVPVALEAAEAALEEGWNVEVVDLRSINPYDDETVIESVRRTGRCVVVQEAQGFAGVGAEIAARVQERAFHSLAAPVLRVAGLDIPYPPPKLEQRHLPGVDRVLDAVARLQWDDEPDDRWLPSVTRAEVGR
ncbi:alpha-ketoacid dehydrogenase subunit beta [Mobilicoccus caccae]|uniref:3-methyl-2-oxobutanoate dehydrogenase (2-methylpropanoyl-transferring) n=1 Tax=Mobilicoccus caccae TaxID=1859295 RepID=A0ABQ6IMY7_9MICO|nr:alpha-ketoacid dehydrogenase subunit beta [Mobilicoccus caccae]GMA39282.1 putative pyruvate dehydrogenase E1 component, beta subunit [Mobilicoccus caccae]